VSEPPGRWVVEAEVAAALDMAGAIDALEVGLRAEHAGRADNLIKTHVLWGARSSLHAIGAVVPGWGYAATKTWASTPAGSAPHLLMFDSDDGSLRAVIQARRLGQLRTGGITAVATKALAAADADELAIIGTGKQALTQVAGVAAVRALRRVRVFGRDREKAAAFCARIEAELGLATVQASTVDEAVRDAPIVTLVTRATEPFLDAGTPTPGAHVNAVGAITPERAEFAPKLLARCAVVATDSVEQARKLAGELREFYGADDVGWDSVAALSGLVASGVGRPPGADLTLFKSMGTGLSDLSLGVRCLANID